MSSSFCPSLFALLFLNVPFNGLSKAITLFELCLWFMAKKTGLILWKLYKLLWMKIEEAPTKMWTRLRTHWFILTADFWLGETLFPRVKKSFRDCDSMMKFPYAFFMRSIPSENLSKYEINIFSYFQTDSWSDFQTISLTNMPDICKSLVWVGLLENHLPRGSRKRDSQGLRPLLERGVFFALPYSPIPSTLRKVRPITGNVYDLHKMCMFL